MVLCVFMLASFVLGYGVYQGVVYSAYTEGFAGDLKKQLRLSGDIITDENIEEIRTWCHNKRVTSTFKEITICNEQYRRLITTDPDMPIEAFSHPTNIVYRFFPQISQISNGYYLDHTVAETGLRRYIVILRYDIQGVLEDLTMTVRLLGLSMLFGFLIFSLAGSARTVEMLSPIDRITDVAKRINGDNLALRIDEAEAQYELAELVKTINSMMDRIQASYNKQMRFVSDVSHELRTPLSVVSGYGNMLQRWGKEDDEILDESIAAIINEAAGMTDLIEKLLFLVRHDNETLNFDLVPMNVSNLLKETIKETQIVNKEFTIDTEIEEDVLIQADQLRIKQLFRILLDNALKYSLDKKNVLIGIKTAPNGFADISFKDYGLGISPKDLPNIFDRFYRADESRTKATGGYGLGLPMSKIIVQGHGGKITVRSKVDHGTVFTVHLPLAVQKEDNFDFGYEEGDSGSERLDLDISLNQH